MSRNVISNVRIAGISSAVPSSVRNVDDDVKVFGEEILKVCDNTGAKNRHVANGNLCASDLCLAAGMTLLDKLNWPNETVDALIFITQTPDYILPATACVLQNALGLAKTCAAFDVNLGCSGYVYGLWLAANLVAAGSASRVLLLVGDTITRVLSPADKTVACLFGDAGSATAIEKKDGFAPTFFKLGTDGKGAQNLIIPSGGFRLPHASETKLRVADANKNLRSSEELYMNGAEIFAFVLQEIIPLISSLLKDADLDINTVDAFVMHQANLFILQYLAKRLNIPTAKLLLTIGEYGNTVAASIPLTICSNYAGQNRLNTLKLVLTGFGVGYSWGAVALHLDESVVLPSVIIV